MREGDVMKKNLEIIQLLAGGAKGWISLRKLGKLPREWIFP
jgi:hypothetical protein